LREGRLVYDGPPLGLDNQRLRELYGTHSDELFMDHPPETPDPLFNPTLQLLAH
jgi:phosphonate transport system ATP-binding protein